MIVLLFFIVAQGIWIETTQEDFADGIYEANIFASMRDGGTIEFTSRWDLSNDGYVDIAMANQQGESYVYWGSAAGYSTANRWSYQVDGAANCDAGDLICDGHINFIVDHRSTPKKQKKPIYWGQR